MRKILIVSMLVMLVFVIYGCKSVMQQELFAYVRYVEFHRLRGLTGDFFVEVLLGKKESESFCEISFIPNRIGIDSEKIKYIYGVSTGEAVFDSSSGKYTATISYDKAHSAIFYDAGGGREAVELVKLTEECPAEELLQKSYAHFEQRIGQISNSDPLQGIEIKILADMSGTAFFYVVFFTNNDFFSVLFELENLTIIAEYIH